MQAQVAAYNQGIDEQHRQFDLTRSDFAPYLGAGTSALGGMGDLLGINGPEAQQAALAALQGSPMLASIIDQGTEGILQNASATGGLRGGNVQRSLADFRADAFNQVLQNHLGQLGGLAGMGLGATGSVAGFGQNTANAITSLLGAQGQARAGDYLTRGGITAGMWKNGGQFLDQAVNTALGGF